MFFKYLISEFPVKNQILIYFQTLEKETEQAGDEQLGVQLKVFIDHKEEDYYELLQRFDNVRLDVDDVNDCFEVVKNLVMDSPAEPYLLSILQHLLFIRDDTLIRLDCIFFVFLFNKL